jgi:GT2 family glycosyltransferase/glycosyltransferase involved in cell wall biosynthesis
VDHDKATPQELRWRIAQLEARLTEQERINDDIQTSTIWRLTAPLRHILRPLSKFVRAIGPVPPIGNSHSPPPTTTRKSKTGPLEREPFDARCSKFPVLLEFAFPIQDSGSFDVFGSLGISQLLVCTNAVDDNCPLIQIDFDAAGNAQNFQIFGFELPEAWGSWTRGGRSQLQLWLPQTIDQSLVLDLRGGYKSDQGKNNGAQTPAHVIINGQDLGPVEFDHRGIATLSIPKRCYKPPLITPACRNNVSKNDLTRPTISVVILNYNKPYLTYATVKALLRAKTSVTYEIIVLDNGSTPGNAATLASFNLLISLVRLNENRFFGEGNNIAAEMARGEYILFLNNDVFIEDDTLDRLHCAFKSSSKIGATGPIFEYPNRVLQEAGAFIAKDGSVYQRGKGAIDFDVSQLAPLSEVDYVSAACLMLKRETFLALGGFDLRYDPAYYEDSDLCLRLLDQGLKTVLVRDCRVVHIENATTASAENKDISGSDASGSLTERHRAIFLTRWQKWLADRRPQNLPRLPTFKPLTLVDHDSGGQQQPVLNAAYSPYTLSQGGGERYLLSAAKTMQSSGEVYCNAIVTPTRYSQSRLNTLCRELAIPLGGLQILAQQQLAGRDVDCYLHMGNELFPSAKGLGARNVFHCQFPFPEPLSGPDIERGLANLATYDVVVVNSHFTREAYLRALAGVTRTRKDVRVIYPSVQMVPEMCDGHTQTKEKIILSIGRFSPNGHAKRQDLIATAFKKLRTKGELNGWRLVLCGQVLNDSRSTVYFERLRSACVGFEVDFVLSPDRAQIANFYQRAAIYVSATGAGLKHPRFDHKCEHFGISVVEAISAGCVPIVAKRGGPAEILQLLGGGHAFGDENELRRHLLTATQSCPSLNVASSRAKISELFGEEAFSRDWQNLWLAVSSGTK